MNLTRRDFARLSALGLAAQFTPTLHSQAPEKKIGYAVIGLGRIAGHFMPGARPHLQLANYRARQRPPRQGRPNRRKIRHPFNLHL